jgi:hypothetical protein
MKFLFLLLQISFILIYEKVYTMQQKNQNIPVDISYRKVLSSSMRDDDNDYIPEKKVISQKLFHIFQNDKITKEQKSLNSNSYADFNIRLNKVEQHLINKIKNENLTQNKETKNRLSIKLNNNGKLFQENEKINIPNLSNSELRKFENSTDSLNVNKIVPNYKIINQNTILKIVKDKTYAEVTDKIKFEFSHGTFSSIIRKISLGGTSDSLIAFKLISNDIKIKEVKLINDCLETDEDFKDNCELPNNLKNSSILLDKLNYLPYICVIAIFDELNANDKNQIIEIEYNYFAQNILRISENKTYSKNNMFNQTEIGFEKKLTNHTTKNNSLTQEYNFKNEIVWYFDNFKRIQSINDIKFKIAFHNTMINSIQQGNSNNNNTSIVYPENLFKGEEIFDKNLDTVFSWEIPVIQQNEIQKISLVIPLFNHKCRKVVSI